MEKLVSVIIPIYNVENYIEKCINSIVSQTYSNLEIIIIDDGSTDKSLKKCTAYKNKDSRIILKSFSNRGVSSARNEGLKCATGEYVLFVDSDDWIEIDTISKLVNQIEKGYDIVFFNYSVDTDKKSFINQTPKKYLGDISKTVAYEVLIKPYNRFMVTKFYKKSMIGDIRFESNIYIGEDTLFVARVLEKCNKIYNFEEAFYHYFQSEKSAIRSPYNDKKKTVYVAYSEISKICKRIDLSLYRIARAYLCEMILGLLPYLNKEDELKFFKKKVRSSAIIGLFANINLKLKIKLLISLISPKLFIKINNFNK